LTIANTKTVRTAALLVAASWLVAHALTLLFPNVFIPWNSQVIDRLFQYRSASESFRPAYDSTIVHIDLNNSSVEKIGTYFPSRAVLGDIADAIGIMGTEAQVWDFIFPDPSEPDERAKDEALIRGTASAGNVYFGCSFVHLLPGEYEPERPMRPDRLAYLKSTSWNVVVEGDTSTVFRGLNPEITFPELSGVSRGNGHLNLRIDRDGVFRRAPLLFRFQDAFYPSMPFRAICDYLGVTPDRIVIHPGEFVTLKDARRPGEEPADIVIPVNEQLEMTVNYVGRWDRMKHISFYDIYEWLGSSDDLEFLAEERYTEGTLAVVSQVTTGASDVGPVPTDNDFPLSGVHANVMHTILTGQFLHEWGSGRMFIVELLLMALMILIGSVSSSRWMWAGVLLMLIGYYYAAAAAFLTMNLILNIITPMTMMVVGFMSVSAFRYINEEKTKEVLRRSFESYFPPGVVRKIMANPDMITVGGQKKELTILFSDIKSFTHHSSTMPADTIQKMLNEYFEAMVDIVFKYEGTVDKFIGDGLMVFFGDPETQDDHALRCVNAALEMQKKCRKMKIEWQKKGLFELKIRVGINTGHVVVGNMGSARRLSYTVLGAPVNMAQRLESNAPIEGIMISERTWELVKDHVRTRPLDPIKPKGIDEPIPVHEVIVDDA
jgi:adenylate cyclase